MTPALTVPQVRAGLASILRAACQCDTEARNIKDRTLWSKRSEAARFYDHKSLNLLPPRRIRC